MLQGRHFVGRNTFDKPDSFRSRTWGNVIPPGGPKVDDFMAANMCGDEFECFSARRWRIGAAAGDAGTSMDDFLVRSEAFVFRLNWLGFRFMAGMVGLMNNGDDGSVTTYFEVVVTDNGG